MKTYRELEVWQKAKDLVKDVYLLTHVFPASERFGLADQLKRAAVSVASNIAEGCGRDSYKGSIRIFYIARGSLYEVETQLVIATELSFIKGDHLQELLSKIESCKRLLNGFIAYYQRKASEVPGTKN